MKILILMPLDEKWSYLAMGLYKALPSKYKDRTFSMPMFMDYLVQTKVAENWTYALLDAVSSAKHLYEASKDDDFILIGNIKRDFKFDKVFNFQDEFIDSAYKDNFLEKIRELVKEDSLLTNFLDNFYNNEDSTMPLHNIDASAAFISDYMQTDPHIDEILEEYKQKQKKWEEKYGTTFSKE